MPNLTIGQFAEKAKVSSVALRFYEKKGLLPSSTRSSVGYRLYSEDLIPRIAFIQNAKSVGFTLKEIKELLDLQVLEGATSANIRQAISYKLDETKNKIQTLQILNAALEKLLGACDGKVPIKECPILERLYSQKS